MGYEIIWEARGVIKRFTGHVTNLDVEQSAEEVSGQYQFDFLRYVINDFLGITSCSATQFDCAEVVFTDGEALAPRSLSSVAVVTTSPEIVSLVAQQLVSHKNRYPTQLFQSMEDARRWLASVPSAQSLNFTTSLTTEPALKHDSEETKLGFNTGLIKPLA